MSELNLNDLRIEIDEIDIELVKLLKKRMDISKRVGDYKIKNNLRVLNIQRELEIYDKISDLVSNKEFVKETESIYFEIMKASRGLQATFKNQVLSSYGLLGETLKHSISPTIHNSLFTASNRKERYELFEIKPNYLKAFIDIAPKYQIKGMNVTIPYKIEVMQYLDVIDDIAKSIGSVNTIKFSNDVKIGYNTDYYGFEKLLEINKVSVTDKNVVILGSGGSSKTVQYYCKHYNAKKVYVVSRNKENTNFIDYNDLESIDFDVLINTTPVGMFPKTEETPVLKELLKSKHTVVDLIYNPVETMLLKNAREVGCKIAINGELMLYYQGLKAQEIWGISECNEDNINVIKKAINS